MAEDRPQVFTVKNTAKNAGRTTVTGVGPGGEKFKAVGGLGSELTAVEPGDHLVVRKRGGTPGVAAIPPEKVDLGGSGTISVVTPNADRVKTRIKVGQ